MLHDVSGDTSAFVSLLAEFITAGDSKVTDLWDTIRCMSHGRPQLTGREFEVCTRC
jgi:hypothetical protein